MHRLNVGRFRKMWPDYVAWISPIRSHIAERAREARQGDEAWHGDVATLGLASFLRALDVPVEVDPRGHRLRLYGVTVKVATMPLGQRVRPTYWVRTPKPTSESELFVALVGHEYPTLALVGGIRADALTGPYTQVRDLDDLIGWISRLSVQADERREVPHGND